MKTRSTKRRTISFSAYFDVIHVIRSQNVEINCHPSAVIIIHKTLYGLCFALLIHASECGDDDAAAAADDERQQ